MRLRCPVAPPKTPRRGRRHRRRIDRDVRYATRSAIDAQPQVRDASRPTRRPLVAVLRTLDHAGAFAVVAELAGHDEAACIRPYTFARRDDAAAFFAEVVEPFTFLGCEIELA